MGQSGRDCIETHTWRYISDMTAPLQVTVGENDCMSSIDLTGMSSWWLRVSIISDFVSNAREVARCGSVDRAERNTLLQRELRAGSRHQSSNIHPAVNSDPVLPLQLRSAALVTQ